MAQLTYERIVILDAAHNGMPEFWSVAYHLFETDFKL